MDEKPKKIMVVLPTWNLDEPRFVVAEANEGIADERCFRNGKCVYNQRLGFAYSVDEIVEILNNIEDGG